MKYLLMLLFLTTLAAATEKADGLTVDTTSIDQRSRGNITIPAHAFRDLAGNHYVRDSIGRCCRTTPTGEVTIFPPKNLLLKHKNTSLMFIDEQSELERLTILNTLLGTSYDNLYSLLETEAAKYCKMTINPSDIATVTKYTALDLFRGKIDEKYNAAYSTLAIENSTDEVIDSTLAPFSLLRYEAVSYLRANEEMLKSQTGETTE